MTPRQIYAINSPFVRASGSLRQYTERHKRILTVLTVIKSLRDRHEVEISLGLPVWHVSVSLWSNSGRLKPVMTLKPREVLLVCAFGDKQLIGVGDGRRTIAFTKDPPADCVHVQKPLTEKEISTLDPAWLALPAIDELGAIRLIDIEAVRRESW